MRVFGRALVMGFVVAVCAPSAVAAAPLVNLDPVLGDCPGGVVAPSCQLFRLEQLTSDPLAITLENLEDVLLVEFGLASDSFFSVTTTPFNTTELQGPVLGVFDPESGSVLTRVDPELGEIRAVGEAISPSDGSAPTFFLEQGTYLLALLSPTNLFGGVPIESIFAAFSNDAFPAPCSAEEGCAFSLSFNVTPVDEVAPVPEPGTLTLVGGGAVAALLRRRRKIRTS